MARRRLAPRGSLAAPAGRGGSRKRLRASRGGPPSGSRPRIRSPCRGSRADGADERERERFVRAVRKRVGSRRRSRAGRRGARGDARRPGLALRARCGRRTPGAANPARPPRDPMTRAVGGRDAPMTGPGGIRVVDLFVYPIKSCGGIAVESAEVDAFGIRNDRRWMVVDAEGRFLTQRTVPLLATIRAGISDGVISLRAAGRETLAVTAVPETAAT